MNDESSSTVAPESGESVQALFARARHQQYEARAAQRPQRVEELLIAFPDLRRHPDKMVDLISLEMLHREERGEQPTITEYLDRFPELAGPLTEIFKVHDAITLLPGAPSLPPGTVYDRPAFPGHVILEEIGRGGMGVVYKARHLALNRVVALKMIRDGAGAGGEERSRFLLEAEAVARLAHPNIVRIYEIGEHLGQPYFSMEFIEGQSLARKLGGTPLAGPAAAALMQTLARAVHAAHQAGIVHRDLKPANILVDPQGMPRIVDFGLAKRTDAEGLTATGAVMGTPSYMAPEQAGGKSKDVGPAADVYALGAILYECLTGRPPFKGETAMATTLLVLAEEPVPPRRLNPRAPLDLENICLKCLQKAPARRYPSAQALAEDLGCFLDGKPTDARPAGSVERVWKWGRRHPVWAVLAGGSVIALAALLIVGTVYNALLAKKYSEIKQLREAVDHERDVARGASTEALAALYRGRFSAAWQAYNRADVPRTLAQLDACPTDLRRWEWRLLTHLGHADRLSISADKPVHSVALSPDGEYLVSGEGGKADAGVLVLRRLSGGRRVRQLVGHKGPITAIAFAPEGKVLASASARMDVQQLLQDQDLKKALQNVEGEVILWDLATGQPSEPPLPGYGSVAFSTDGGCLAWSGPDHTIRCRDRKTGKSITLYRHDELILALTFGPVGLLASASVFIERQPGTVRVRSRIRVWDVKTNRPVADFQREGEVVGLAFDPSGRRLALAGQEQGVALVDPLTGKEVGARTGHRGAVLSVAFSPGGEVLATGCKDRTVRLWDTRSGQERGVLRGHEGPVGNLVFDPGRVGEDWRLASTDREGAIKLWDPAGTGYVSLRGHAALVRQVVFSPDSKRLASASADGTVKVWNPATGKVLGSLKCQAEKLAFSPDGKWLALAESDVLQLDKAGRVLLWRPEEKGAPRELYRVKTETILAVAFSPDGKHLALSSGVVHRRPFRVGKVLILRAADGRVVGECQGEAATGSALTFSPDGATLAVGKWNGKVELFAADGGKPTKTLVVESGSDAGLVFSLAYSADGRQLAVGNDQKVVRLWAPASGRLVRQIRGHDGAIFGLAFSPDGSRLAAASLNSESGRGDLKLWDPESGDEMLSLPGMFTAAFSPDGRCLAAPTAESIVLPPEIRVWRAAPDRARFTLRPEEGMVRDLALAGDEGPLASAHASGAVHLWDPRTGRARQVLQGHAGAVLGLAIRRDGSMLTSAGADKTARLWPLDGGEPRSLPGHEGFVFGVAFSPNGKRLATASVDRKLRLWDVATGEKLWERQEHKNALFRVAFAADGMLATSDRSGTVILWDAEGNVRHRLAAHEGPAVGLAFHPDGGRLATAGADGLIQVWDCATGKTIRTLRGHALGALAVAYSPDGKRLASGSHDQTVRLWDADTGREQFTLRGHTRAVWAVVFAANGEVLYSGAADQTIKAWDVSATR